MILLSFVFILCNLLNHLAAAGECQIHAPTIRSQEESSQIGLIFIPGAKIPGSAYLPLLDAVQEHYPGSLWVGATDGWLAEMPNPVEIGQQINKCLTKAAEAGYSTDTVFFGGHSLGGIVLETYISGHADIASGIALLGTWIPDLLSRYDVLFLINDQLIIVL